MNLKTTTTPTTVRELLEIFSKLDPKAHVVLRDNKDKYNAPKIFQVRKCRVVDGRHGMFYSDQLGTTPGIPVVVID